MRVLVSMGVKADARAAMRPSLLELDWDRGAALRALSWTCPATPPRAGS